MRLLVLLSRIPYPLEKGDKLRAWHQIKELSKSHEVHLVCLSDSGVPSEAYDKLKPYCKEIHIFKLNRMGIAWRLFLGLFSTQPFQVHYFHSKRIQTKINRLVNESQPDHLYAQLIRVSEYVKNIHHIPKTLDYMDALSKGMQRRVEHSRGIKKWFLKKEASRLLAYENLIFDYFENKTIISEQDRNLIYHPDQKKIKIVSNGVDTDFFHPMEKEKKYELVFNGNMSYPPNVDGALFLMDKILPRVKSSPCRILISGANPANSILSMAKSNPQVTVSGWMDDIRNAYAASKIFIAPMQIGTGLQNKLLEAMAMGLPCITTELANNALGAIPEQEILVGNSAEDLAGLANRLLTDQELYAKIAQNGKQFVMKKYNWETATQVLNEVILQTKK